MCWIMCLTNWISFRGLLNRKMISAEIIRLAVKVLEKSFPLLELRYVLLWDSSNRSYFPICDRQRYESVIRRLSRNAFAEKLNALRTQFPLADWWQQQGSCHLRCITALTSVIWSVQQSVSISNHQSKFEFPAILSRSEKVAHWSCFKVHTGEIEQCGVSHRVISWRPDNSTT